ncbi:hypothetical protein [Streptomyces collinus]|uniref:hypothetical protein n=1 Tax=Streptomyces collinus TaxID=42684 RepID=UPI0010632817
MHSNDEPRSTTGGLSTGDLARPAGPGTGAEDEAGAAAPSSAPIYPGESTGQTDARPPGDGPSGGQPGVPAADGSAATGPTESPAGSDATGVESRTSPQQDTGASDDEIPHLLTDGDEQGFRDRWQRIQSKFVDDPQEAVHDADALVADVMQTLATTFDQHKKNLEGQWNQGTRVDTEELRGALRHYRSFFNRLLSS